MPSDLTLINNIRQVEYSLVSMCSQNAQR